MKKIAILFTLFLFCAACQKEENYSPKNLEGTLWKRESGTVGIFFNSKTECDYCFFSGNIVTEEIEYTYVCNSSEITLTPVDSSTYNTLHGEFVENKLHIKVPTDVGTLVYIFIKQ